MLALLAALASSAFAGQAPKSCVRGDHGAVIEPQTLDDLVACQRKALDEATESFAEKKGGRLPSESLLDKWQDAQRAEVRYYLKRHPDRAALASPKEGSPSAESKPDSTNEGVGDQGRPKEGSPSAGSKPNSANEGIGDEDRLKADLWKKSDDGKKGVTPEMAREITDYLNKKQGSVSPEMQDLLDSLQKDGVKLTDESMLKLKKAARAADGAGLDLGVDSKMKQDLLDPGTDPNPGDRARGEGAN